jgi:hypothetical protein
MWQERLVDALWWLLLSDWGVPAAGGGLVGILFRKFYSKTASIDPAGLWVLTAVLGLVSAYAVRDFLLPGFREVFYGKQIAREVREWVESAYPPMTSLSPLPAGEEFRYEFGPSNARTVVYLKGENLTIEASLLGMEPSGRAINDARRDRKVEIALLLAPLGVDVDIDLESRDMAFSISRTLGATDATFGDFIEATSNIERARNLMPVIGSWQSRQASLRDDEFDSKINENAWHDTLQNNLDALRTYVEAALEQQESKPR